MLGMMRFSAALLVLVTFASTATALAPEEVLVVANDNSPDSVELARTYAASRGIPDQNIAFVKTTTNYDVSRTDYQNQVRAPVRQILTDRGLAEKIRCVVLMWGVPVRVTGEVPKTRDPVAARYQTATEKAHYRLMVDYKLLGTVGLDFPAPGIEGLKPIGKLFSSPIPSPSPPLTKFETLQKDIDLLLAEKQAKLGLVNDPAKHLIALRQLMALHLDVHGLEGLTGFIRSAKPSSAPDVEHLQHLWNEAQRQLAELPEDDVTEANIDARLKMMDAIGGAALVYSYSLAKGGLPERTTTTRSQGTDDIIQSPDASVDSELALMWWPDYKLAGWANNLLYWRSATLASGQKIPPVVMTARIDGPSAADAMRTISVSSQVEKAGLKGNFYIDSGGMVPQYDSHLRALESFVKTNTKIKTVMDTKRSVFQPDTCPDAALYVGWYSLEKYVAAFTWAPGAVGWHVASFEAVHLREPNSMEWCVKLIQNGVVATIGAVSEPTLSAFPMPEEFFPMLLTGKYTLAECYWRTVPYASWKMTLIGDPLYNPFATDPQVGLDKLPPGLAP